MTNQNGSKFLLGLVAVLAISATGCTNLYPTPAYASTGDLVQIGLGGVKRNTNGKTLTKDDLYVTITSAADGIEYQVKVRGVYRAFPDHTSQVVLEALRREAPYKALHPYDGQWWATLQLVEHNSTNNEFLPLPLASGPAVIKITSADLVQLNWQYEGSLTDFAIEMMPDAATPSMARIRQPEVEEPYQFVGLTALNALNINPDTLDGVNVVGGLQVKLEYNPNSVDITSPLIPRLVPISHDPNINVIQHTVDIPDAGDGRTRALIAMVTNPKGFVELRGGSWEVGNSTFEDLQFAVTLEDYDELVGDWTLEYALDPAESFYIDTNGEVIAAMTPVLTKSF
jgi:hypothetical protein